MSKYINKHVMYDDIRTLIDQVDPSKSYDRLARIYYDAIEERIAIHEHEEEGQERDAYDEIALYEKVGRQSPLYAAGHYCSKLTKFNS